MSQLLVCSRPQTRSLPCAARIAVMDEQKYSRPFTAATIHIATDDVFIAGPASVRKKGQYAGVAWTAGGQGRALHGTDGRSIELLHCVESARWNPVEWISNNLVFGAM